MDLYFLRHGEADWPDWKKSDDERPLTAFGKKEMHDVAKFLGVSEQQVANIRFAAVKKLTEHIHDLGLNADVFPELRASAPSEE